MCSMSLTNKLNTLELVQEWLYPRHSYLLAYWLYTFERAWSTVKRFKICENTEIIFYTTTQGVFPFNLGMAILQGMKHMAPLHTGVLGEPLERIRAGEHCLCHFHLMVQLHLLALTLKSEENKPDSPRVYLSTCERLTCMVSCQTGTAGGRCFHPPVFQSSPCP